MLSPVGARVRIALLILTAFGVYLVGNGSVGLFDRDEPRYAQCSREMLYGSPEHPGPDFVVPRHLGQTRYAKPVFIYWCQAAAMRVLDDTAFAARLPSAIAMPLTLSLVAAGAGRRAGRRRAAWTVFVLATSAMVLIAAKACLTDSVLLLSTTFAQGALYLLWRRRGGSWTPWIVLGVAVGFAGLTKGPVILGVIGMTLLALLGLNGLDLWMARRRARGENTVGAARMQNEANVAGASTVRSGTSIHQHHAQATGPRDSRDDATDTGGGAVSPPGVVQNEANAGRALLEASIGRRDVTRRAGGHASGTKPPSRCRTPTLAALTWLTRPASPSPFSPARGGDRRRAVAVPRAAA